MYSDFYDQIKIYLYESNLYVNMYWKKSLFS